MKKNLCAAIIGIAFTATACLSAHAQDLKAMLLKPANGWVMEWNNPDTHNSGVTEAVFMNRGAGVVVKLYITEPGADTSGRLNCESNVTIAADAISLTTCRGGDLVLILDPSDTVYPFKSKQRTVNGYAFKVKVK